jgi:outer membrane lipoprotein-sorting protein
MHKASKFIFPTLVALLLLAASPAIAAPAAVDQKDEVLRHLDQATKNFRSTSADFQFDTYISDPIPDQETQKGSVYYERPGKNFRMAAHIREDNKKPVEKIYTFSGGVFQLYEGGNLNQLTTFSKASKFESYLMLGFGASGKDIEEKWDVKYLGSDTLLDGNTKIKTDILELIAKDPAVRKTFPKVTVWMDTERAISLKQVFDEGQGQTRVAVYFNIRVNQPLPDGAFTIKTNHQTQFVNR